MVTTGKPARKPILDLVLVARGEKAFSKRVGRLLIESGDIECVDRRNSFESRNEIRVDDARLRSGEAMLPVRSRIEVPGKICGETLESVILAETGGLNKRWPGYARPTGVAANGEAQLVCVAEGVAEVAGERSSEEGVVRSLPRCLQVRSSARIVQVA